MREAYIYDHVRTPRGRGKMDGGLHEVTALRLATVPLVELKKRNQLPKSSIDDVILGVLMQSAKQAGTSRASPR